MATANVLATFQITPTPTSLINGGTASYAITSTANSNTPFIVGDRYFITFPSEIDISSATCTTITCSRNAGQITFDIPSPVPNPVAINVNNLVVQKSTRPISTAVQVQAVTTSSTSQVISTHATTTVPTTSVAGTLTSATLVQSSYVASTATTYTFGFRTANPIPSGGVILIANNPSLTFTLNGGCTSASGSFGVCTFDATANGVIVPVTTQIPAGTTVSINVASYTNPTLPTTTSFVVESFDDNTRTYKIDRVDSGLAPSLECNAPCKTCVVGNKSQCTSCFTSEPSITQKYYVADTNTCVNSCPSGYSQDNTAFTCTRCNTNCKECAANGATTTCTQCNGSDKLYNAVCYPSCTNTPVATYESSGVCYACNNNCKTCSGSATTCTSCDPTNLHNNACIANCPSTFVAIANVCTACNSNCLACSGTTTTCTSCGTSNPILHLAVCRSDCPGGFIPAASGTSCDSCLSPCATCISTTST